MHQLLVRGVPAAVPQVLPNGAGEQPGLLLDVAQMVPEGRLGHPADVGAVQLDGAAGHVVEPEDQGGHGGLAAAGAADDGGGLPPAADKVQMAEGVLLRVLEPEGHVPEGQDLPPRGGLRRGPVHQVHDLRRVVQHLPDPLTALQGPGQGEDHHLGHHQEEQHQDGVLNDGGDVADLDLPGIDLPAAEPVGRHDEEVDEEEGQPVQIGEQQVGADGGIRVVGEGGDHAGLLPPLAAKGPDHPDPGEVLQQDGAHPVQQPLELAEQGRGAAHDPPGQQQHGADHRQQQHPHPHIQPEGEGHGRQADHRHRHYQLQRGGQGELDGGDVGDGAGGDGGGAELPEVVDGQLQALGVEGLPHLLADPGGEHRAGISPQNGAGPRRQGDRRHPDAGADDVLRAGAGGAGVQHLRHQGGDHQPAHHVQRQQDDGGGAQFPMGLQESQDQLHGCLAAPLCCLQVQNLMGRWARL